MKTKEGIIRFRSDRQKKTVSDEEIEAGLYMYGRFMQHKPKGVDGDG